MDSARKELLAKRNLFVYIGVLPAATLAHEVCIGSPWESGACLNNSEAVYTHLDWVARFYGASWAPNSEGVKTNWGVVHFRELITNENVEDMSDKRVALVNGFLDVMLADGLRTAKQAFQPLAHITPAQVRGHDWDTMTFIMNYYDNNLLKADKRVVQSAVETLGLKPDDALYVRYRHPDIEVSDSAFWAWNVREKRCMFRGAIGMACVIPDTISQEEYQAAKLSPGAICIA